MHHIGFTEDGAEALHAKEAKAKSKEGEWALQSI